MFPIKGTTSTPLQVATRVSITQAAHAVAVSAAVAVLEEEVAVAVALVQAVHAPVVALVMAEEDNKNEVLKMKNYEKEDYVWINGIGSYNS